MLGILTNTHPSPTPAPTSSEIEPKDLKLGFVLYDLLSSSPLIYPIRVDGVFQRFRRVGSHDNPEEAITLMAKFFDEHLIHLTSSNLFDELLSRQVADHDVPTDKPSDHHDSTMLRPTRTRSSRTVTRNTVTLTTDMPQVLVPRGSKQSNQSVGQSRKCRRSAKRKLTKSVPHSPLVKRSATDCNKRLASVTESSNLPKRRQTRSMKTGEYDYSPCHISKMP